MGKSDDTTKYINLTKGDISRAPVREDGKRAYYYFEKVPGLVLQVTASGVRTFQVYKRIGKGTAPYRKALGRFPDLQPEEARKLALAELSLLTTCDPRQRRREDSQKDLTFGALFQRYMDDYAKEHTKTWQETEACYRRYFHNEWHSTKVSTIRNSDVDSWLRGLKENSGAATANRNFDTFRAVVKWGVKKNLIKIETDPCVDVDRYKVKARERFLLPSEFEAFKAALDKEPSPIMRDFFWMCLLTGNRAGKVMAMRWDQITFELGTWRIPDTKNDDAHTVNLTVQALQILEERWNNRTSDEWVFPGRSSGGRTSRTGHLQEPKEAWKELLKRAGLYSEDPEKRLRIHDLRHTLASYMAIQGVDTKIIGKALGHRSAQATARYAHLTNDPVRLALENAQAAFGSAEKLLNRDRQTEAPIEHDESVAQEEEPEDVYF